MGSEIQNRTTSIVRDDPLPYAGPRTPSPPATPSPRQGTSYLPEPSGEPILPESALTVLETYGDKADTTTLRIIALGLVGTLKKRELEYQQEKARLIKDCQEAEEHMDHVQYAPYSYIENDGQASGFVIPTGNGEYEPAYYIKRLPEGRVAGHPESYTKGDVPFIADSFALPAGSQPSAPLPNWLLAIITGTAAQFETLVHATRQHDDWGLEADIRRARAADDQTAAVSRCICQLRAEQSIAEQQRDLALFHLELARLPHLVQQLQGLAGRPRERKDQHVNLKPSRRVQEMLDREAREQQWEN